MMTLHSASSEQIRKGEVTDVYFPRTLRILREKDLDPRVRAEFVVKSLPDGWRWAVLAGVEELLGLATELGLTVRGMPEGSLFGSREPVIEVSGPYRRFCVYETAFLGFLCQATGVATRAARCRLAARARPVISFGARRLHPAAAPVVERAAWLGGCEGVATLAGADLIGIEPSGTIPHALILVMGDTVEATRAFDEIIPGEVPRISLIDTFRDEKFEAIRVAGELGEAVDALRLDTPSTRRGDFRELLEEVRWELDARGHHDLELFVSGGIDEEAIRALNAVADGYGVGGAISAAPIADFSMDIVEIDGRAVAKRGKWSGAKQVFVCRECRARRIHPLEAGRPACERCGGETDPLLRPLVEEGERRAPEPSVRDIREDVLAALDQLSRTEDPSPEPGFSRPG